MLKTSLLNHVTQTIRSRSLFNDNDTIIIALSGGADSCALLDILTKLKNMSPILITAHINHCLRGDDSNADENFVRNLSKSYEIPFESCKIDVAGFAITHGLNLEDAGRKVRMQFLDKIRIKHAANAIVLAHHSDDQAETILTRLLRGSGGTGLSGMAFHSGSIVRPLLDVTRAEIRRYIKSNKLQFREDVTNLNTDFLRNRIRHELLPLLCDYNPSIQNRLNISGAILADESNMLDNLAEELILRIGTFESEKIKIPLKLVVEQPVAMQRRLYRRALEKLAGNLDNFSYLHIEALLKLAESSRPNLKLNLPQGIIAVKQYETIIFSFNNQLSTSKFETETIYKTGNYKLHEHTNLNISIISERPDFSQNNKNTAFIDLNKAPFPWVIRSFESGDKISPLGMRGTKKIKDLFIDKKVPTSIRKKTPLIFSQKELIWACGICNSEHVKIDCNSSVFVKVTLMEMP